MSRGRSGAYGRYPLRRPPSSRTRRDAKVSGSIYSVAYILDDGYSEKSDPPSRPALFYIETYLSRPAMILYGNISTKRGEEQIRRGFLKEIRATNSHVIQLEIHSGIRNGECWRWILRLFPSSLSGEESPHTFQYTTTALCIAVSRDDPSGPIHVYVNSTNERYS